MIGFLDDNAPTPEQEFAEEIKAYEKEETAKEAKAKEEAEQPAAEPEAEVEDDDKETQAKSDDDEEVSAEPESEGAEEAEAEEGEDSSGQNHKVPVGALTAQRQKTSAAEQRAEQLQRQFDEMNGQMRTLMQMYQPQQPGAEQQQDISPDPEEDPIGAIAWTKRQMEKISQAQEQQTANQTRTVQEQKLAEICTRNTNEFLKETPDYIDAYKHLMQSRISELRLQGLDDDTIGSTIRGEEQALAVSSLQQNINPASRVYDLAKARGYTGKAQANPTAAPKFDPEIEEKKKSASLNTRGNPPKGAVTDKELANMSGADFDKSWEKVFGKSNKSFV
jgi:hypothetical protein